MSTRSAGTLATRDARSLFSFRPLLGRSASALKVREELLPSELLVGLLLRGDVVRFGGALFFTALDFGFFVPVSLLHQFLQVECFSDHFDGRANTDTRVHGRFDCPSVLAKVAGAACLHPLVEMR